MDISILIVLIILFVTITLLVFEVVRTDVIALLSMLSLGWTGILTPQEMFSGFSGNAVIAMMAVMIMGRGVTRTGLTDRLSRWILSWGKGEPGRITSITSLIAGVVSGFIQNIGTAALFLPVVTDTARKSNIPASRLLIPVGYAIILGGTLTMIGSGHLILVNDLLESSDLDPLSLFAVTPVGLILLTAGIVLFYLFGKFILPGTNNSKKLPTAQEKLIDSLQLPNNIWYYSIKGDSQLIDLTTEQSGIWKIFNINIIGISGEKDVIYAPWRETRFRQGHLIALLGSEENIKQFAEEYGLNAEPSPERFARLSDPDESGFAEVIVPPRSEAIGQTIRQFAMRRRFAVEPLRLFSKGDEMRGDFSDHEIAPGDAIIVYGLWENIHEMNECIDFVVATPYIKERKNPKKVGAATISFLMATGLTLAGFPIALSFFTGAIAMVLFRVLNIQQAYQAIDWKIVFLLAGLLPLGVAVNKTGTSTFLAGEIIRIIQGQHPLILITIISLVSMIFSWSVSNFGAIVIMAPMVIAIAELCGLDARSLVLMSAVSISNSFILPTQQVNALITTPGNYRNTDFLKSGAALSLIFMAITITYFYLTLQ